MASASGKERYERVRLDSKGRIRDAWGRFLAKWQELETYESNIEQSDRLIHRAELKGLLQNNVCEIIFVRRRPERAPVPPRAEIRRMLCTNSLRLLTSYNGKLSFTKFAFPRTGRRIDEVRHNIVVGWDIFWQDYRNISMDECYLRQTIPDDDTFWKYYNDKLFKMSPETKLHWMDSVS